MYICVTITIRAGAFPGSEKTCWELWHTMPDFIKGGAETLCHLCDPSMKGWVTVPKEMKHNNAAGEGVTRGAAKSIAKTTNL
jgi:hypothetical protein